MDDLAAAYLDVARAASRRVNRMLLLVVGASALLLMAARDRPAPGTWAMFRLQGVERLRAAADEDTRKDLDEMARHLKLQMLDSYSVRVPFFDIRVNLEETGVFGGATLVLLSAMLFRASQRRNVAFVHVFERAEEAGVGRACYRLLAGEEVGAWMPTRACPGRRLGPLGVFWPIVQTLPAFAAMAACYQLDGVEAADLLRAGGLPAATVWRLLLLETLSLLALGGLVVASCRVNLAHAAHLRTVAARVGEGQTGPLAAAGSAPDPAPKPTEKPASPCAGPD